MTNKIQDWIKQAKNSGWTNEQMRQKLKEGNYTDEQIGDFLNISPKKKSRKKIWAIIIIIVTIVILRSALYFSELPIKLFPQSNFAAKLSGYETTIKGNSEIQQIYYLTDGSFLVTRETIFWHPAAGFRAFPSGGIPYYLVDIKDILRVTDKGEVLWQIVKKNTIAENYNTTNLLIENYKEISSFPAVLSLPHASVTDIRECNPTTIQIARITEEQVTKVRTYGPNFDVIEINLENGDISIISDVSGLCDNEALQKYTAIKSCNSEFDSMEGVLSRQFGLSLSGYDFRLYGKYLNTCISPLLENVTSTFN